MIIHVLAAISIVGLVLVQQGKGATAGASFGGGASQTMFGSRGSGSFLMKLTIGFVVVFFSSSIALNYLASQAVKRERALNLPVQTQDSTVPVSPSSIPMNIPEAPADTGNKK